MIEQVKAALQLWSESFSECGDCLLVAPGKLSPDARKETARPDVTVLTHDFLLFPVGRHRMVPRHQRLTSDERAVFLERRKLAAGQLPQLKTADPVAVYYGYKPGDVVRISRPGWDVFRVVAT